MVATTFLVFYRFKTMNKDDAQKANTEWHELKNSLPSGVELVGEYDHAYVEQNTMDFCYLSQTQVIPF